ncbi:MAG: flagellar motor protein MotB [Rhodospirillales bacterium]
MSETPIIVKKKKRGGHKAHGGAWKVAYADFVTAMMAFFLLLWLLNAATKEQLEGISNYFAPITTRPESSGGGGFLAGDAAAEKGNLETRDEDAKPAPPSRMSTAFPPRSRRSTSAKNGSLPRRRRRYGPPSAGCRTPRSWPRACLSTTRQRACASRSSSRRGCRCSRAARRSCTPTPRCCSTWSPR